MNVLEQTRPQPSAIPGVDHATWAGAADGLSRVSVWRQTLAPGAATPPHRHDCDEVVLCLQGRGELHAGGVVRAFDAPCTVVLPAGGDHQLFNTGAQPMELIAVFGGTPVATCLPDGQPLELPWRT